MKKLLLRVLLNVGGVSFLSLIFGWFLFYHPGQSTLIDLELACGRGHNLHLFCHDRPAGTREGWSSVYTPEGQLQLEQQVRLARTLYRLPADFRFKPWTSRRMCPDPPWLVGLLLGVQICFWVSLAWADPVGRLIRARPSRRLLTFACLAAPSLGYLPHIVQDHWMRLQVSPVVKQDFKLLWNEREGHYGVVVILLRHPAEVEQALRVQLKLRPQDQLSVVYINSHEMPPILPWAVGAELLGLAWATHCWLLRRRALPV